MGDGPVANLPDGLDAYGGYVDNSGIGETYAAVVARFPHAYHLPFTTKNEPAQPGECADVENGADRDWSGYDYGYAAASNIGTLILRFGRPKKLLAAHHNNVPHICTSAKCWPVSPVAWIADGTQWTDHGGAWDESLLSDSFFGTPPPAPRPKGKPMYLCHTATGYYQVFDSGMIVALPTPSDGTALGVLQLPNVGPVTDAYVNNLKAAWDQQP